MEVLTLISSSKDIKRLFKTFIENYDVLFLSGEDKDTLYYEGKASNRNEIYLDKDFLDFPNELSYNYPEKEQQEIKSFFGSLELFAFDISYRDEFFIKNLLNSFKLYLENKDVAYQNYILISHPFEGIIKL